MQETKKIGLPISTQSMIYNLMYFWADWNERKQVYSEVPSSAILLTAMAVVYKTVYLGQDSHWLWVERQLADFR